MMLDFQQMNSYDFDPTLLSPDDPLAPLPPDPDDEDDEEEA